MIKLAIAAIVFCVSAAAFGWERGGYQYQADADRRVHFEEAKRIVEGNGGHFVGPRELAAIATVPVQGMPAEVPFTARDLLDCPRPCALVLTVDSVGDRRAPATIKDLIRATEFRDRINLGDSKLTAWFLQEPFASRRLRNGWILASLRVEQKGVSFDRRFAAGREGPLDAASAFWLVTLLPPEVFNGQFFYTADSLANRDMVIAGRSASGALVLDRRLRAIGDPQVGHLQAHAPAAGAPVETPPPERRRSDKWRVKER